MREDDWIMTEDEARKMVAEQLQWEDKMINAWPIVRAFLLGALFAACIAALVHLGLAQRQRHADTLRAIRGNDIAWEVCRAVEGMPAHHGAGGGWIRASGLTSEQYSRAASAFDNWVWTDAAGHLAAWPSREDDATNDDEDACSEAWRVGYSAVTEDEEGGQP